MGITAISTKGLPKVVSEHSEPAKAAAASESLTQLLTRLRTSEQGLSEQEAAERIDEFGPNDPAPIHQHSQLGEILRFCANPMVLILLVAAIISYILGDALDAFIIMAIVVLSVAFDFFQTFRTQQAVVRLREQVAPTATVLRDGAFSEQPRRSIVPGDIIRLSAGDLVPADARLIKARDLHVQQAALTGESLPVEKSETSDGIPTDSALPTNMVYLGTSVVSGAATAVVISTGRETAFGDIAVRLSGRPPETEFDRGAKRYSILIMETVLFLVLFILAVNIALHRNPLESLLFAVALAVGLTPEFLPMITTVTLSIGAVAMARHKVIVKHLDSIQNFGSIDILCSDKTGTITTGMMTLDRSFDAQGRPDPRALQLGYLNALLQTGIKSPLDDAVLAHKPDQVEGYEKTDEVPFDFERRRVSVVVGDATGWMMIVKGAPESVVGACSGIDDGTAVMPMDDAAREHCRERFQALSREGFRMLAVAYRRVDRKDGWRADDEHDLVLAGYLTFLDPPREGVKLSLAALRRDGVAVKIITGDNELVTKYICSEVGIESDNVLLGDDIDEMNDPALAHNAEKIDVFARVSPAQKNRIIMALKSRGHVVGYMGDGINDAPSLHSADVGISVAGAVDVAKDAADIILLESGLEVLHQGILEGRKAFGNVLKYLLMGTSSNFGNVFSMAGASLFLPFLPMLPTQILLNNFLYNIAQITIPTDNVDEVYINKPQKWDIGIIRDFMVLIGPISSIYDFLTFYILLKFFNASAGLFHTGWFVESLATQTLIVFVIRTAGSPFSNRPSKSLTLTTLLIVALAFVLPYVPLAQYLRFVPLPATFLAYVIVATVTYMGLVEIVKRRLMRRFV